MANADSVSFGNELLESESVGLRSDSCGGCNESASALAASGRELVDGRLEMSGLVPPSVTVMSAGSGAGAAGSLPDLRSGEWNSTGASPSRGFRA